MRDRVNSLKKGKQTDDPVRQSAAVNTPAQAFGSIQRTASNGSAELTPRNALQLQRAIGNRAVMQLAKASPAADKPQPVSIQRKADEGEQMQVKEAEPDTHDPHKLPPAVQDKMESAFGSDFSNVSIHANSPSAPEVGALAYTQGSDVHFAPGQYNPHSEAGQQLLGHELTHVVQQREGRVEPTRQLKNAVTVNDDPGLEREADDMGRKVAAHSFDGGSDAPVQRAAAQGATEQGRAPAQRKASGTIQRLPSRKQVEGVLGKPKEHVKNKAADTWLGKKIGMSENLKENSTRYRNFLDVLDRFNNYVDQTVLGDSADAIEAQLEHVKTLYDQVDNAALGYVNDKKKGDKVQYVSEFRRELIKERRAVILKARGYMFNPPSVLPKWWIMTTSNNSDNVTLTDSMSTGETAKGGINTVNFFDAGGSMGEGVFKEQKNTIDNVTDSNAPGFMDSAIADDFGIDKQNARMAQRNVAMSRLDQLLGAGVIARAQMAVHQSTSGSVEGSFMSKAKGKAASKLAGDGMLAKDASDKTAKAKAGNVIDVNDGNLQRCMSRLQLIDIVAMQADRSQGNFFIQYDKNGNVLGVTGIDNDLAFGTRDAVDKPREHYPGLSKFVDEELAQRILNLKDSDLELVMADLLSQAEIDALLSRLHKLQAHLQQLKSGNKLLKPNQWNAATAKGMLDEGSSYYGVLKDRTDQG